MCKGGYNITLEGYYELETLRINEILETIEDYLKREQEAIDNAKNGGSALK